MSLIKSISGIRGTIGGKAGEGLSPEDVVRFTSAFAAYLGNRSGTTALKVVVGRDARISGEMVYHLVAGALSGMGVEVLNAGLSTTPTIEMAVTTLHADGGIIITASHNPKNWNALKLLNNTGEFLSAAEGEELLSIAQGQLYKYADVNKLGKIADVPGMIEDHIQKILSLPLVNTEAIMKANFSVVVDCINSTGAISVPPLLEKLGVKNIKLLHGDPTGNFAHNPEPLPENLRDLSKEMETGKYHVGFAVDPDVDRLAIVEEDGSMFGEEYTLVAIADYILKHQPGNTVSNLSSTRALKDITEKHGLKHFSSAVGEVNVVEEMKKQNAVIGGEGNGGIIYPDLHYGRDALLGIALFLSHLATSGKKCSMLRSTYPNYFISKNKIELQDKIDIQLILNGIIEKYRKNPINTIDGIRIEFGHDWVHLRRSNTEPIIRIYAESDSENKAEHLAKKMIADIKDLIISQL